MFVVLSSIEVEIHWQKPEKPNGEILEYNIFKATAGYEYSLFKTVNSKTLFVADTGLLQRTTYRLVIVLMSSENKRM